MSLLGLIHFPSSSTTSTFSTHHHHNHRRRLSSPHTLSLLSHTLPTKSQRPNFLFHSLSTLAHTQATVGTQEIEQSEPKEIVVVEEEEVGSSGNRVLAQNVPWTSTVDDLRPLFEKYGCVIDIELSMYKKTRNRGLAFVTMGSHEEALAALNNLESYEFEGRTLKLEWAKPRKKKPFSTPQPKQLPIHNLFVANLPFQARANELKEFFNAENANVVSAEIIFNDNPRRSAGYGYVSFNTEAEAEVALSAFQGKEFMGRAIQVARSKRFLRQETKAAIESENALS